MSADDTDTELPDFTEIAPESPQNREPAIESLPAGLNGVEALQADKRREKDDVALSQLVWTSPAGRRFPLKLTASKWSLFQSLASMVGGDVASDAVNRQYVDAQIILFLAANRPEVWKASRDELPPLRNDFTAFLDAIEDWADEHVSPAQMKQVVEITDLLLAMTWRAQAVGEEGGGGEKKT